MAKPMSTSRNDNATPSQLGSPTNGLPLLNRLTVRTCEPIAAPVSRTPRTINAIPAQRDSPGEGADVPWTAATSCKNKLKRATTNPKPMSARPVRIQARKVRSAAKKIRGSGSGGVLTPVYADGPVCEASIQILISRQAPCR
jgi:hypothetical protein